MDDVGAEVGEQGAGQRPGDDVGELDDLEARQGAGAGLPGFGQLGDCMTNLLRIDDL